MQQAGLACLYHVASTDANPNHHVPAYEITLGAHIPFSHDVFKHKHELPEAVVQLIGPTMMS